MLSPPKWPLPFYIFHLKFSVNFTAKTATRPSHVVDLFIILRILGRTRWPHGLRRGFSTDRLQGLGVPISPGTWVFLVSVVCCEVEVSATSRSLVQRSPTEYVRVIECDQVQHQSPYCTLFMSR